jgi:hypothetical protein
MGLIATLRSYRVTDDTYYKQTAQLQPLADLERALGGNNALPELPRTWDVTRRR